MTTSAGVDMGCALTRVAVPGAHPGTFTERAAPTATDPDAPGRERPHPQRQASVLSGLLPPDVSTLAAAVPFASLGRSEPHPVHAMLTSVTSAGVILVPRPVAALTAVLRDPGYGNPQARLIVVADLGAGHAELLLCEVTSGLPKVRDAAATGAASRELDPFWMLAELALPHAGRDERLALAGRLAALPQADLTRADLAVKQSMSNPSYRSTPVYGHDRLSAGEVVRTLEPVAQLIGRTAAQLAQTSPEASRAPVLFVGGGSGIGLLRGSVLKGLGQDETPGSVIPASERLRTYAAARGAALVAAGAPGLAVTFPHDLALELHWQRADRLESGLLPFPGSLRAGEPARFLTDPRDGVPARIEMPAPEALKLWLRRERSQSFTSLPSTGGPPVPPGRYRVGLRLDGPNLPVMVFAPLDGGAATAWPVSLPEGPR